jgi:hypothetical protein
MIIFIGCSKTDEVETYKYVSIDENISIDNNITNTEKLITTYKKYWEASSKGDLNSTYTMELPYLNFIKSLKWYRDFKADDKHGYKATALKMEADALDHDVVYIRSNFKSKVMDVNLTEKWIYISGAWYHYYRQSLLPPPPKLKIR